MKPNHTHCFKTFWQKNQQRITWFEITFSKHERTEKIIELEFSLSDSILASKSCQLQVCLSMCDLLVDIRHQRVKQALWTPSSGVQRESFRKFVFSNIETLFYFILLLNVSKLPRINISTWSYLVHQNPRLQKKTQTKEVIWENLRLVVTPLSYIFVWL